MPDKNMNTERNFAQTNVDVNNPGNEPGNFDVAKYPLIPDLANAGFTEGGKRGQARLSPEGRTWVAKLWASLYEDAGGDSAESAWVREKAEAQIARIDGQKKDSNATFARLAEQSLKKRVEHLEMQEQIAELSASNSPWKDVLDKVQELYPKKSRDFVQNFAIRSITKARKQIKQSVSRLDETSPEERELLVTSFDHDLAENIGRDLAQEENKAKIKKLDIGKLLDHTIKDTLGYRDLDDYIARHKGAALQLAGEETIKPEDIPEPESKNREQGNFHRQLAAKLKAFFGKHPRLAKTTVEAGISILALLNLSPGERTGTQPAGAHDTDTLNQNTPALIENLSPRTVTASIPPKASTAAPFTSAVATPTSPPTPTKEAEATATAAPTATVAPTKETPPPVETTERHGFKFGPIDLRKPFTIRVPEELASFLEKEDGFEYLLDHPLIVEGNTITKEIGDEFNNYVDNPRGFAVVETDIPNNHMVFGHSITDNQGNDLPFEWVRLLVENHPREALGQALFIEQETDEGKVIVRVEIAYDTILPAKTFANMSSFRNDNGTLTDEPIFYWTYPEGPFGFPEEARQENQIHLVACGGEFVGGEEKYGDRDILTLTLSEIIEQPGQENIPEEEIDPEYEKIARFILDQREGSPYGQAYGENDQIITYQETSPRIKTAFTESRFRNLMRNWVRQFVPSLPENQIDQYLDHYPILLGPGTDQYLEEMRGFSTGSTPPEIINGNLRFGPITFTKTEVDQNKTPPELVLQEFLQAHQYNELAHGMEKYLAETADGQSPEALADIISHQMRPVAEIIQQEELYEKGVKFNTYFFQKGDQTLNEGGWSGSDETVNLAYQELVKTAKSLTGKDYSLNDFFDSKTWIEIDQAFREKNRDQLLEKGYRDEDTHFWNEWGMSRPGFDEEHSLNQAPLLS